MLRITNQDKEDFLNMLLSLGVFISALSLFCFVLSTAIGISFDHSRHVVASLITVIGILYVGRELFLIYWRIFAGLSGAILLAGFYGASTELYIEHFTLLGTGNLPALFTPVYLLIICACIGATVVFIKKDFFHVNGIAFNGV